MPDLPSRSSRPTLATWLFLCAMGTMVAGVLTCTIVLDRFVRAEDHQQATQFLQAHADALRDALDRGMAKHVEETLLIAKLDPIARGSDPQAARRLLEQARESFPELTWIGLTDDKGVVVAAVDGLLHGASVTARPWFGGAMQQTYVGDVHRAVLLEKLLPAQPEPWRFVDVSTPVRDANGEFRGVLGVHLSWSWAGRIKRELVDGVMQQHQAEAIVLAADGTVLLGPEALEGRKLADASEEGLLRAESKTRGAGRYPGLGWNVVLRQPEAVAMAPFAQVQKRMQWAAVLLCLLVAPLLWLATKRLAAPLLELTRRLEAGGDATTAASTHDPLYREADVLGQALARYAQRHAEDAGHLRELNATLEVRIAERTAALAGSEQRLRTIADNLPVLISYIDKDERYQFCNATYRTWMGVDIDKVAGRLVKDTLTPENYAPRLPLIQRALAGERTEFDMVLNPTTAPRHVHTTYLPDLSPAGVIEGIYVLATDVSAMKTAEEQLISMARTDTLTGLPNRLHFNEKLGEALARGRRHTRPVALLFLDVDKFKSINDSLGHAAGDEVLKTFAARLRASVRETDTVARLAGDEFVVILEELHTPEEPQFVARKILASINRPFEVGGGTLAVTSSIGIAYHAEGAVLPAQLLASADQALYEAKAAGRNTFRMAAG